jgi:hypothetical protein
MVFNMKSTQAMRDRCRELSKPDRDDYDRAVICIIDDLEALQAALREATIVTDEMVMAGAKAMVRLGHDHRTRGEPMPTRLQEARACLTARAALDKGNEPGNTH